MNTNNKETSVSAVAVKQSVITHGAALRAIQAAVDQAEALGVRVNIAVADTGGNLAGFLRMPGAFLISIDLAQKKARCAAGLGIDANIADAVLAQENPRLLEGLLHQPDFIRIRGGLPIRIGGELIGAIGVSGASEAEDVLCAEAGVAALNGDKAV